MNTEKFFTTMSEFSIHIENLAKEHQMSHLEALSFFCEDTGAEYEAVAMLVSPTLKQRIYEEASKTYAMPKMSAVQLDDI
jgi:Phage late-transcription coactivator